MAGEEICLSSDILRSSAIEILSSGIGSLPKKAMEILFRKTIPEMMKLATTGKLIINTVTAELTDIETNWQDAIETGKRLVIII